MTKDKFEAMEVKTKRKGWYLVTLFQFKKEEPEHPDYIRDWLNFDGDNWDYEAYKDCCYVCFVHKGDAT